MDLAPEDERNGLGFQATSLCFLRERPAPGSKKRAIVRKLKQMPARAVLVFEDETILRLLPELRRAWSKRGEQAVVPITGQNAKRVLYGTINMHTGHRVVSIEPNLRQEHFQAFLRRLRHCYRGREIWMILDRASGHVTLQSQALARELKITLIWLPRQCSELNAMDQFWKGLKDQISANYQFKHIDKHAAWAKQWTLSLTPSQSLRLASILSEDFWLKSFLP